MYLGIGFMICCSLVLYFIVSVIWSCLNWFMSFVNDYEFELPIIIRKIYYGESYGEFWGSLFGCIILIGLLSILLWLPVLIITGVISFAYYVRKKIRKENKDENY